MSPARPRHCNGQGRQSSHRPLNDATGCGREGERTGPEPGDLSARVPPRPLAGGSRGRIPARPSSVPVADRSWPRSPRARPRRAAGRITRIDDWGRTVSLRGPGAPHRLARRPPRTETPLRPRPRRARRGPHPLVRLPARRARRAGRRRGHRAERRGRRRAAARPRPPLRVQREPGGRRAVRGPRHRDGGRCSSTAPPTCAAPPSWSAGWPAPPARPTPSSPPSMRRARRREREAPRLARRPAPLRGRRGRTRR